MRLPTWPLLRRQDVTLLQDLPESPPDSVVMNAAIRRDLAALRTQPVASVVVDAMALEPVALYALTPSKDVTHQCPVGDSAVTPCCGVSPFELPRMDRITMDAFEVTCRRGQVPA